MIIYAFFMRVNLQGRTGTKFSTGHKPPRGAPTRGVNQTSKVNIFLLISSSGVRKNNRAKKTAGVWGRCKPPNGARGEATEIFKIDNSMRKSSCSVSSRVRLLGKFCPWIAVTTS